MVEADSDPAAVDSRGQPDNILRTAGVYVVMRRPKEVQTAHREYLKTKAMKAVTGPRDAFKEKARRLGVKVDDTTRSIYGDATAVLLEED